jgi:hypothetical protein
VVALSSEWPKRKLRKIDMEELRFPKFDNYLDESDLNVVVLRCQDGSFVATFSARGATREGFIEAAREGYRELLRAQRPSQRFCT